MPKPSLKGRAKKRKSMTDPNTFDKELKDAQANPAGSGSSTDTETTVNPTLPADTEIDYKTKFGESSKEALRLLEENKTKDAEIERLRLLSESGGGSDTTTQTENLYPGFNDLDEEAKTNLVNFANVVAAKAKGEVLNDPALRFAQTTYNETKWNQAFEKVASQHPELANSKDEFKSKYFNPANVPENIENILGDVAKIYLFDKAKEIGATEERQKESRIDLERATGGERQPTTSRTLGDWQRMAAENPAEFAKHSKEYHNDLASGKLKE